MELLVIAAVVFVVFRLLSRHAAAANTGASTGALVGPVGWVAGTEGRVVGRLPRADTRRVLRHPAFIAGVILTPLMLVAATESENNWLSVSGGTALALVPLG